VQARELTQITNSQQSELVSVISKPEVPSIKTDVGRDYHLWYFDNKIWEQISWLGVKILKSVSDMWNYQEIIYQLKPTLIIEFGTCYGGSALFFATVLQTLGYNFKVLSVDTTHELVSEEVRQNPFIELFLSSSIDPQVAERIISLKQEYPGKIFAILDSDHNMFFKKCCCYARCCKPVTT